MKGKVSITLIFLLAFGLLFNYSPGFASEDSISLQKYIENGVINKNAVPKELKNKLDNNFNKIDNYLTELYTKKNQISRVNATINEKQADIGPISDSEQIALKNRANDLAQEIKFLEENMEQAIGLVQVTDFEVVQPYSAPNDIRMSANLYYESDAEMYVLIGDWSWMNNNWQDDASGYYDIGGLDGFYLRLGGRLMAPWEHRFRTWSNVTGQMYDWTGRDLFQDYGISWTYQDQFLPTHGFNGFSGAGYVYFSFGDPPLSGQVITGVAGMAHTWKTTSLSGIGISSQVATVNWVNIGNQWERNTTYNLRF